MTHERVNADFSQRVVIATDELPWLASPQAGVERRLLDRVGGEVARATSLVRYAPESRFPAHEHALGEEFLVLHGVFADEHGEYPAGTYVRNPPGSAHAPRTGPGCIILVKLRQMTPAEQDRVVVDTIRAPWPQGAAPGHARLVLHAAAETVTMERLAPGTSLAAGDCPAGEEIFVLSGMLLDEHGAYRAGTWLRHPPGFRRALRTKDGVAYWAKRGHLTSPS